MVGTMDQQTVTINKERTSWGRGRGRTHSILRGASHCPREEKTEAHGSSAPEV